MDEYNLDKKDNLEHEGIDEWYLNNTERIIAIKYSDEKIDEESIKALLK